MNPKSLSLTCLCLMTLVGFISSTEISARANEVRYPVDSNRQAIDLSLANGDKVNPEQLIQQGQTATKDRDWGKAETIWQQVIQLQPNNAYAYSNLCEALARQDKLDRAKAQCQKAIEVDPKLPNAYYSRGFLKGFRLNDSSGALADYNKAIESVPNHAMAHMNRGFLKSNKLNDISGALADYNKAISIYPKFAEAYAHRADLKEQKMQDRAGAIQDYRQAVKFYREEGETANAQKTIQKLRQLGAIAS